MKEELASLFKLREVRRARKIVEGIWSTGKLGKHPEEPFLVPRAGGGVVVLVGCPHPGVQSYSLQGLRAGKGLGTGGRDARTEKALLAP